MNNVNDNKNIFIPSFEFEKKTKGFNKTLWGFVGLISMFTVGLFVYVFHLMICSVLNITSTFISDNATIIITLITLIFALMFGIGLFSFINGLMHSYKFEDGKIIKGRIMNADKVKGIDLTTGGLIATYMIKNIDNPNNVTRANALKNSIKIFNLIKLNTNKEFVNKYFDTPLYKKKIYTNSRLLKETKYHLIYVCDNNKKLKIPKIYDGMDVKLIYNNYSSLISRVLIRSLIVFLIFFFISVCDLVIGYNNNDKHIDAINNTYKNIEYNLTSYGYVPKKINEKNYRYIRESNDRTSNINYYIDKNGNIYDVKFDIYYSTTSNTEELYFIINSLNDDFTDEEIGNFISNVDSCINGTCSYNKLVSDKNTIRIGTSNGLIQVHN